TSNDATLGFFGGSSGTATIDGAGSNWTANGAISVGGSGAGTLTITNGATVQDAGGYIAGGASPGDVTVSGAGSSWINTSLVVGINGPASLTIADGGTVSAGTATLASTASSSGTLNIGAAAGSAAAGAGRLDAAALQFGAGAGTIVFNHTDANYSFDAALSGSGTINQLAGNTTLTADSSTFAGAANVLGGRLAVNGSLANTSVAVSGTGILGGSGRVGAVDVQAGGTVAPGNSIGTLNVGSITFAVGSTYQVEVNAAGQGDRIVAAGLATLNGGTVGVLAGAGNYPLSTRYTILTANGGVSGQFAAVTSNFAFLTPALSYDATNAYVTLDRTAAPPDPSVPEKPQPIAFASVAATRNQAATAGAVESLGSGSVFDAVLFQSAEGARAAFDALSGEIHASAKGVLVEEGAALRDAATGRLRSAFGAVGAAQMATMNYGFTADLAPSATGPMPKLRSDRFALWGQGYGSWGRSESDRNAGKLTRSSGGLMVGGDVAV
ncbi:autotransporter outer membrane beta-barrel domain-containing protein, partial [Bosea caraganae]